MYHRRRLSHDKSRSGTRPRYGETAWWWAWRRRHNRPTRSTSSRLRDGPATAIGELIDFEEYTPPRSTPHFGNPGRSSEPNNELEHRDGTDASPLNF